jgi:hypothetical protein
LTAWWVVFLVYLGASRVIAQILQTHSLRTFREALLFNAANIVLVGVSWAILAIVVVREITRGQTSAGAHARSSSVDRDVAQPLT